MKNEELEEFLSRLCKDEVYITPDVLEDILGFKYSAKYSSWRKRGPRGKMFSLMAEPDGYYYRCRQINGVPINQVYELQMCYNLVTGDSLLWA